VRTDDEKLRKCPTCRKPIDEDSDLGRRDFARINAKLPGRMGMMDIDRVLERKERIYVEEEKPWRDPAKPVWIPWGQLRTLRTLVRMGADVLVSCGPGPEGQYRVGWLAADFDVKDPVPDTWIVKDDDALDDIMLAWFEEVDAQ
jgi:hypothetical protein